MLSADPQRRTILTRIRGVFRHLPPKGAMVFFDIKPVTVKRYGGRQYTRAQKLVLPRPQKTRGRFYLYLLYDAQTGRVRWAFEAAKDSAPICRFLRKVRRWYAGRKVWVVLDQDSAHPRKSRKTRRTMRELGLRWISLPKRSPDDNPVETINRDVQGSVLDCSDDADAKATQRRISAHLRGRNRRHDPRVHIHYFPDSHKH